MLVCHIRKRVMLKIVLDFKFCYAFAYISGRHLSYSVWDEHTIKFLVLLKNVKLLNLKEECCYCVNIHNEAYHNPVFLKLSSMDEPIK